MKTLPFDLSKAMGGHPLVTRDGKEAKFIAYVPEVQAPIIALIKKPKSSVLFHYQGDGRIYEPSDCLSEFDLFLKVPVRFIALIRYKSGATIAPIVREDKKSIEEFVKEHGFVLMSDIHEIPLGEQ